MNKILLTVTLLGLLSGCAVSQTATSFELKEFKNLSYTTGPDADSLQSLHLVVPQSESAPPLLIWIGGGAWAYVNKDMELDLARNLGHKGIAMASVGHRLSPAVWRDPKKTRGIQHPKHAEDVAAAVKWLYDHAAEYGYDRGKCFIGGYSSGAHLAALIDLDKRFLGKYGLSPDLFKGVIPISGAFDIVEYYKVFLNGERPEMADQHVKAVFGPTEKDLIDASPTSYLENLSTPMLLMCDNNLYNYTRLFEDRIRATEFRDVRVMYAYNFSHSGLWRDLSSDQPSIYRNAIIDFIEMESRS